MSNITERQTLNISVDMSSIDPSRIVVPVALRFAADELVLKAITYATTGLDVSNIVQIWCSITNDGLLGSFPNAINIHQQHDDHFSICNTFQSGNITFQFQKTIAYIEPFYYNPQPLISDVPAPPNPLNPPNVTRGILSFTVEFVKHSK